MVATNQQLLVKITALESRVKLLEARPTGTDYSAQLANLQAQVDALKLLTCPEVERFKVIELALGILNSDHVPA